MTDIVKMTNAQIDVLRFKAMKDICDRRSIVYPQKLKDYIDIHGDDTKAWGKQ